MCSLIYLAFYLQVLAGQFQKEVKLIYSEKTTIFEKFSHLVLTFLSKCQNQVWDLHQIFWPSQKTSTLREIPPSSFHAPKGLLTHTVSHSHFENDNRLLLITIVQGFAHTFYRALFSVPYHVLKCKSKTNKKTGTKNLGA